MGATIPNAFLVVAMLCVTVLSSMSLAIGMSVPRAARDRGATHGHVQHAGHQVRLLWTARATGNARGFGIDDGAAIVQTDRSTNGLDETSTEALDTQTGRRLWTSDKTSPIRGSPLFLAVDNGVERIAPRTGVVAWRSKMRCERPAAQSYVTLSQGILYVGCQGGSLFALSASTGRVLARANPATVANYDQIVSLGKDMIGVSGTASGARSYRQSAIVDRETLSTLVKFSPDVAILGHRNDFAIIADTCCFGRNTDSSPAIIKFISLHTGAEVTSVSLHPSARKLSPEKDLPGAGPFLLIDDRLYVGTSEALFVYKLTRLFAPRIVYTDLAGRVSFIQDRYAFITQRTETATTKVAIVDIATPMPRTIWSDDSAPWYMTPWEQQGPTVQLQSNGFGGHASTLLHIMNGEAVKIDTACDLMTSSDTYILTLCEVSHRYQMYTIGS